MENLRKGFPVLEQYTYLNTAASGLLPEKVWEFRQDHDLDFLVSGGLIKEKQGDILLEVRKNLGKFFSCAPNRTALVPNFSYGFNSLLERLPKPQKALLLKNDYPSVNHAVESREFEVIYAEINENLEENITEAFEKNKPGLFAFSLVQYLNGIKLDPTFLKKLKEDFPETLFVADGTQYFGTQIFDFDKSGPDVVISSGYKWLNAGYGNGFMLFKGNVQERLNIPSPIPEKLQGKYKPYKKDFIGQFEPGHQDSLNYGSLGVALELLEDIGMDKIEEQVVKLSRFAKVAFSEMDLLEEAVVKREEHSSIFNLKGNDEFFRFLRRRNIIASQRGNGIRVSFHYFNTQEELDHLIAEIKSRN